MTDNKISVKTLGLFAEMYFTATDDGGYNIYPYRSYSSTTSSSTASNSFSSKANMNSSPYSSYKWDEDTAARIFRDCFADLKDLNSYDLSVVKLKKVKLPCQLVDEHVQENNPYNTLPLVDSLFKETEHPPRIFCKRRESNKISVDLNGKTYDLQEINSFMDSDESMKEFLNILIKSYKHEFKRSNNSYLDCMFLMHKITKLRIALPMKSDNDITTCAFAMVCVFADLSIRNSSSLHYSNLESGDKMYCPVVPAFTLEFGKMISMILRKPVKPSLNSFYNLLLFDLSCPFRTSDGYPLTTRKDICTVKNLIDSSGHLIREISWEIMLNVAKKWNHRISVFECLYCYDLDESRWFKFDEKTKRQTAINRAINKHVVHPFCLDDLKIRSKILGCGPYSIKDEDKSKNDSYISTIEKILQLQGLNVEDFDLKSIKNESQHSKLIKNVLKSEKKTNTLIFDLSKKRLDQLESKSIENNSLLRFRTLFYPDKMSLDILKDLLFDKQKKNYSTNSRGCLRFDWDCERCLMSLLQSTLDIYFSSLKIFCNIIENKVRENVLTNNMAVVRTSMRNVFENDIDEADDDDDDDDNKPNASQNKNQETTNKQKRATFVLLSALEYFLPSAILDFCFCSKFNTVVPETTKKSNDHCEVHKNESNSYIVRCFENTVRFYEDKKNDPEIDTKLFERVFLTNKSIDEMTTVKMNLVELLQQIVKVGQQYEKPKKKNKKSDDENDQENNSTATEEKGAGTNMESTTNTMDDGGSREGTDYDEESESDPEPKSSPLSPQELFPPSKEEEKDRKSGNHLSKSEIQKSPNIAIDMHEILKFSSGYYPDDDSFVDKLKEVFHILSVHSSANLYINIRGKTSDDHSDISVKDEDDGIISIQNVDDKVEVKVEDENVDDRKVEVDGGNKNVDNKDVKISDHFSTPSSSNMKPEKTYKYDGGDDRKVKVKVKVDDENVGNKNVDNKDVKISDHFSTPSSSNMKPEKTYKYDGGDDRTVKVKVKVDDENVGNKNVDNKDVKISDHFSTPSSSNMKPEKNNQSSIANVENSKLTSSPKRSSNRLLSSNRRLSSNKKFRKNPGKEKFGF
jgi:hypothetical protein